MKSGCADQKVVKTRSIELPVLANAPVDSGGIRHSRTSRWRAGALITLNLLMIAHIVQWRFMGQTVSPIEPSETMYTLRQGAVNAGAIFFSLAILSTLIFGRYVCGWGCHIVSLQDFCAWLLKKVGLKPRPFRSRLLVFVPLLAGLYMFVWPVVLRALTKPPADPLIPQFTNHLMTTEFWATFPPVWIAIPFLFICGFVTVYFLGSKGFCTYACPYGGFFAVADKFAPGKIRVTDACNQCGHCTATCMANVQVHAEVKQYGMVIDPGCMKHMDCISVCPNDALYFGFGKPSVAVPKTITKNYPLTWPEEIFGAVIFFLSLFAVWDVYQIVPMLMALGIAAITAFLALRLLKLFRSGDLAFYHFNLRSGGTVKTAGWVFMAVAVAWLGVVAHSGWIRYHESFGTQAFQNLKIPDELALAEANPDAWISPSDRRNIAAGEYHLRTARDFGLFTNIYTLPRLAWFEYLSGDTENALKLLAASAEQQEGQARALSLYYRGTMLNRLTRYDEALTSLDQALAERPDLVIAREEKGESLWQLGRHPEAVSAWREAVEQNASLPLANNLLSGSATLTGDAAAAAEYASRADRYTPADPLFHWMLGLRLQNAGMYDLAEKHFALAIERDPSLLTLRKRPAKKASMPVSK